MFDALYSEYKVALDLYIGSMREIRSVKDDSLVCILHLQPAPTIAWKERDGTYVG